MPTQQQKMLASAGFWQRLGLTASEIVERLSDQYSTVSKSDIAAAISLQHQQAQAGQAVMQSPSGVPVYGIGLPVVVGQGSPFEYKAQVPIFDPENDRESSVLAVIRSNIPLTYSEIEARALQAASLDIAKSEYDKAYRGLEGFQPDILTPNAVQVVSASTWDGPKQYMAFGT